MRIFSIIDPSEQRFSGAHVQEKGIDNLFLVLADRVKNSKGGRHAVSVIRLGIQIKRLIKELVYSYINIFNVS